MAYVPNNVSIYTAAYTGALAGMGASDRVPTIQNSAEYSGLAAIAGAFAEAFDSAWGDEPINDLVIQAVEQLTEVMWQDRAPQESGVFLTPLAYTDECAALIAIVQAGVQWFLDQEITPPNTSNPAVVFDGPEGGGPENIRTGRLTGQSPIDNTKLGIVNLGTANDPSAGVYDDYGTVAGGVDCAVEFGADHGTVTGGEANRVNAGGVHGSIGGGLGNVVVGNKGTVAGGTGNLAAGEASSVGGGDTNASAGTGATVPGGRNNAANGDDSTATGNGCFTGIGTRGAYVHGLDGQVTLLPNAYVHGGEQFDTRGDAQYGRFIVKGSCNGGGGTVVLTGPDGVQFLAEPGKSYAIQAQSIITNGTVRASFTDDLLVHFEDGVGCVVDAVNPTVAMPGGTDMTIGYAGLPSNELQVTLDTAHTGEGTTVRAVTTLRWTEVAASP